MGLLVQGFRDALKGVEVAGADGLGQGKVGRQGAREAGRPEVRMLRDLAEQQPHHDQPLLHLHPEAQRGRRRLLAEATPLPSIAPVSIWYRLHCLHASARHRTSKACKARLAGGLGEAVLGVRVVQLDRIDATQVVQIPAQERLNI